MRTIVTRFAPSPTGHLHVGGARTALFNWLYARNTGGKFILRIEDTDTIRSTRESVDTILESLDWLGIKWDEGPYFQTNRLDIYKKYLKKLIESGHAYYCNCSQDNVDIMRNKAMALGYKPKYNGKCRDSNLKDLGNLVIRFKSPLSGTTIVKDVIKGSIKFQNTEQDDFIICRGNGTPTYNFVVVIDDMTMGVNTVIRGDDHLMNTPKQIMIYNALKSSAPTFGHVPMVLGKDKSRLSKRHGATSVITYKNMGYLPNALINYIARLGWSYGNQEFFNKSDLVQKFNLKSIGKSASIFNPEKLKSLNAEHIRSCNDTELVKHTIPFMIEKEYDVTDKEYLNSVVRTLQNRAKTLCDIANSANFYYEEVSLPYDEELSKKFLKPTMYEPLSLLLLQLKVLNNFKQKNQESVFKWVLEKTNTSFSKIAQTVRVALTGKSISPGIFEIIEVLGKDVVLKRLELAKNFILEQKI